MDNRREDRETLQATVEQQRRRQHIFVVDSSRAFQDIVGELLEDERYGVTTSDFVPEIFPLVIGLQPDLIIVDLAITAMTGWELLEQLEMEALTRRIPVIVTSTDRRLLERAEANRRRYGFDHYLIKPFDLDVLLEAVHVLIGKA